MSYTELYVVRPDGQVTSYAQFGNAHGGAMAVWRILIEKYFGVTGVGLIRMMDNNFKELFDLQTRGGLESWEDLVLTTTHDNVIVPIEHVETVAAAMEKFDEVYGPNERAKNYAFSIGSQAKELRQILAEREEHGWRGVCWNQTSVSCPIWSGRWVELSKDDPHYGQPDYDQTEQVPYNVDEHDDHWFYEPAKSEEGDAGKSKPSKEFVYDQHISPLMTKILKLCKEHRINMAVTFALDVCEDEESEEYGEPLLCTSVLAVDKEDAAGFALVNNVRRVVQDGWTVQGPLMMAMTITSRDPRGSGGENAPP